MIFHRIAKSYKSQDHRGIGYHDRAEEVVYLSFVRDEIPAVKRIRLVFLTTTFTRLVIRPVYTQ